MGSRSLLWCYTDPSSDYHNWMVRPGQAVTVPVTANLTPQLRQFVTRTYLQPVSHALMLQLVTCAMCNMHHSWSRCCLQARLVAFEGTNALACGLVG